MRLILILALAAVSTIAASVEFLNCPPRPPIAQKSSSLVIESFTGKVTAKEISTFTGFVGGLAVPTTSLSNVLADGFKGMNVEAMGLMYELVRDPQLLDTMIRHTDAMLHLRNNPVKGQVMWTGKKELVWVTKSNGPEAKYAGSENGDTIGHIAYAAKLILQTRCLHNSTVKVGDKYGYGKTYYRRAVTYVKQLERSMDTYFIPWFFDNKTLTIQWPKDKRFPNPTGYHKGGHIPGSPFPWNQQMMFNNGLQRLAEAHVLLGDRPDKVRYYDSLVKRSIHYMTDHLLNRTTVHGQETYLLLYSVTEKYQPHNSGESHHGELTGIHLLYDFWGLIRGYHRTGNKYKISKAILTRVANTIAYVLDKHNGKFAANCDGTGTTHTLHGPYIFYSEFNSAAYLDYAKMMARGEAIDVACVLFMKSRVKH